MRLARRLNAWVQSALRSWRFATAHRPTHPSPEWISDSPEFCFWSANPMAPIPASTIGQMDDAAAASRFLARYAMELQSARESLDLSRDAFSAVPMTAYGNDTLAASRHNLFDATERARRALETERDALCLASRAIREKLCKPASARKPWIDRPDFPLGGLTLLSYFVSARRIEAVEWIIWAGASPDAANADGSTALALAARKAQAFAGNGSATASLQSSAILSTIEAASLGILAKSSAKTMHKQRL